MFNMEKISLPLDKVKEFLASSVLIPHKDIMPITRHIKIEVEFEVCTIIKSNTDSFCRFKFDLENVDDCIFLIDEEYLDHICKHSTETEITLEFSDGFVDIKDGKMSSKRNLTKFDLIEFPHVPDENEEKIIMQEDAIKSIYCAKNFLATDSLQKMFAYVYVDTNVVYASDRNSMYLKSFNYDLPKLAISSIECDMLYSLGAVQYSKAENFNTYKRGAVEFGYITHTDSNFFDYKMFQSKCTFKDKFTLQKSEFLKFCNSSISFADKKTFGVSKAKCSFSFLNFSFKNKDRNEENKMDIQVNSDGNDFEFNFSNNDMSLFLKSLPYDSITVSDEGSMIAVTSTEDKNFFSIIMKMQG